MSFLLGYYHFSFTCAISNGFRRPLMVVNSGLHLGFCNGNQWENKIDLIESLCTANFADRDHFLSEGYLFHKCPMMSFMYMMDLSNLED